jgi:hypothetical protein
MNLHARYLIQHSLIAAMWWLDSGLHAQTAPANPSETASAEPWHFKLTLSNYDTQNQTTAQDINLRGTR